MLGKVVVGGEVLSENQSGYRNVDVCALGYLCVHP